VVAAHGRKRLARIAAEVTDPTKTIFIPGFSYVQPIVPFSTKLAEEDFRPKYRLLFQSLRLDVRHLKVLE